MGNPERAGAEPVPVVMVPEIRDYTRINAEVIALLEAGHSRIRLAGAAGHRLLAFGLRGAWNALIEVDGRAGPELAAEVDAPGLVIVCSEAAAEGAGRGFRSGRLVIVGDAGSAVGYCQQGGTIVVAGSAGPRAGLDLSGGLLVVGGDLGRLAGERQRAGVVLAGGTIGPFAGTGQRGGRLANLAHARPEEWELLRREAAAIGRSWPSSLPLPATLP